LNDAPAVEAVGQRPEVHRKKQEWQPVREHREPRQGRRAKQLEHDPVADHMLDVVRHHRGRGRYEVNAEAAVTERGERRLRAARRAGRPRRLRGGISHRPALSPPARGRGGVSKKVPAHLRAAERQPRLRGWTGGVPATAGGVVGESLVTDHASAVKFAAPNCNSAVTALTPCFNIGVHAGRCTGVRDK
jgi:hypothetical protein